MVESASFKHPVVDLDEFERRLRGPDPSSRSPQDDPLAELARLVNGEGLQSGNDPVAAVFGKAQTRPGAEAGKSNSSVVKMPRATWDRVEPGFAAQPAPPQPNGAAALQESLRGSLHPEDAQSVFEREMREIHARFDAPPAFAPADAAFGSPLPAADFEAVEAPPHEFAAGLDDVSHPDHAAPQGAGLADAGHYSDDAASQGWRDVPPAEAAAANSRQRPQRRPVMIMSLIAVAGLSLVGGTFAWRANSASGPKNIAIIKAPDGPAKVAANVVDGTIVANQDASILDKVADAKVKTAGPTRVATLEEQPVDLNLAPKAPPPPAQLVQPVVKALVPPPPEAAPENPFGPPKRVKTVSVRPDGSVVPAPVPDPVAVAPQASVPALVARPVTANPLITTPSLAPATPPAKPKATVRVVAPAKPDIKSVAAPAAVDDPNAPLQLGASAATPKAARVKLADTTASTGNPDRASGGKFAVQLAAPNSEQDAKDASSRLRKQFASELEGHQPSIHPGTNSGRSVFRVRIANMSKDSATALCEKLKASGGNCFVAGN